jgi:hypothetical protein
VFDWKIIEEAVAFKKRSLPYFALIEFWAVFLKQ